MSEEENENVAQLKYWGVLGSFRSCDWRRGPMKIKEAYAKLNKLNLKNC